MAGGTLPYLGGSTASVIAIVHFGSSGLKLLQRGSYGTSVRPRMLCVPATKRASGDNNAQTPLLFAGTMRPCCHKLANRPRSPRPWCSPAALER
eukprot:scaffold17831_cov70-Phaeocystis_antarctica.AAC.4